MQSWRTILSIVLVSVMLGLVALPGLAQDDSPFDNPPAEKSLPDLIDAVEPSVVIIKSDKAMGSGFLVSTNGIVVTNHHVMDGASTAKVIFADKKEYDVEGVLKMDAARDIAVIKINSRKTKILKFASSLPRKGEKVYTFGTPLGQFEFSISEGIVSGIRTKNDTPGFEHEGTWLQSTAPISSGNSGGPLVNARGEVVGMNTMIYNRGHNLNFAICNTDIEQVLDDAKKVKEPIKLTDVVSDSIDIGEEIESQQIADAVFKQYFDAGAKISKGAIAQCKDRIIAFGNLLKMAKAGLIAPTRRYENPSGAELGEVGDGIGFYFRDSEAKEDLIETLTLLIADHKSLLDALQDPATGPLTAAVYFGPQLSIANIGNIGRIEEIKVERIIGEGEFIGILTEDKTRVVVAGIATDNLRDGQTIYSEVFLYAGIVPYTPRGGYERRMALLLHLPSELLESAYKRLYPGGVSPNRPKPGNSVAQPTNKPGPSRLWKSKDRKFYITAKFIRVDGEKVVLQPESGLAIRYAIDLLSPEDQEWILKHISK